MTRPRFNMATFKSGERVNELIFGPDLNDFLHQESSCADQHTTPF